MAQLTNKQERALTALVASPTPAASAACLTVGERSLWRWLQQQEFQEAYRLARRQAVEQAITSLQKAASMAVDTLKEVMGNAEMPPAARVSAARITLELAVKVVELEEIETRLSELEEQAKGEK